MVLIQVFFLSFLRYYSVRFQGFNQAIGYFDRMYYKVPSSLEEVKPKPKVWTMYPLYYRN